MGENCTNTRRNSFMPETFKQNFVQWFIAFSVVAILGLIGWGFNVSNRATAIKTSHEVLEKDVSELRNKLESVSKELGEARIELSKFGEIDRVFIKNDSRMDLHSSRLSAHQNEPHHKQAGIEIGKLTQRISDYSVDLEVLRTQVIKPMKDKLDLGDRYTLRMATSDQNRILKTIDKIESSHEKDMEKLYLQLSSVENRLTLELQELRASIRNIINSIGLANKGTLMNPAGSNHSHNLNLNPQR